MMPAKPIHADYILASDLAEVRRIQDEIESALQSKEFGDSDLFAVKLAVEEALVNAIKHGNKLDPRKTVEVHYTVDDQHFEIRIKDQGPGFDPGELPDPTAEGFIERPCGRGVMLIRSFMTYVDYRSNGTEVLMSKVKSDPNAD